MLRKLNALLIVGILILYLPIDSKELSNIQEIRTSSLEEVVEEMIHLNANLELLTTTISNLFPRKQTDSNL